MNEGINILEETITALCCFIDVALKKIFWRKSVYIPLSLTQKLELGLTMEPRVIKRNEFVL